MVPNDPTIDEMKDCGLWKATETLMSEPVAEFGSKFGMELD
jgi:hypothetical protein